MSAFARRDITVRARLSMQRLPAPLRGLVLDSLVFSDVLSATTADRAGRAVCGYVRRLSRVNDRVMSSPHILNKFARCEAIRIESKNALVLINLGWALQALRHLNSVRVAFAEEADLTSWPQSCATLSNSPELVRLRMFRPTSRLTGEIIYESIKCDEFKSLLLRLNPDCALASAIFWRFPAAFVSELVRRGANPNAEFLVGNGNEVLCTKIHALEAACANSELEVIQLLLDAGAKPPDRKGTEVDDVFLRAVKRGSLEILRLLYDAGFKTTNRSPVEGNNLLHCFAFLFQYNETQAALALSTIQLICEREPELLTQVRYTGHTPLMFLVYRHCEEDAFLPNATPSHRAALFESLSACMRSCEAKLRLRAGEYK